MADFYMFLPMFRTFSGDFNPQKLPSRRLQTLWEQKNRVLLEEYYILVGLLLVGWVVTSSMRRIASFEM